MKICFINPSVGTIRGGTENIIYNLVLQLKKDHEVVLVTGISKNLSLLPEIEDLGVPIITLPFISRFSPISHTIERISDHIPKIIPRTGRFNLECISMFFSLIRKPGLKRKLSKMDVISTHHQTDAVLYSRLFYSSVPVLLQMNGGRYGKNMQRFDRSAVRLTNSQTDWENQRTKIGIEMEGAFIPGIPPDLGTKKTSRKNPLDTPYLLFVGRLEPVKGVRFLLKVFKRLVDLHPQLNLAVVGSGTEEAYLKHYVSVSDLESKVHFLGNLSNEELYRYYGGASALVFPVLWGSFGIVVVEAMAFGIPVVTTNLPGLKEFWEGKAVLLPPSNTELWVRELNRILTDKEFSEKMSTTGLEWAKQFTWDKKAKEYERYLVQAMEK